MFKKITISILLISSILFAQKPQTIAFIDMEYILQNIPDYEKAQLKLDSKASQWRKKIERSENEIEKLKSDLSNEKILLTEDLIVERQEDISIKEKELSKMRASYFGTKGAYFELRKQLVQPIQDEVFNAIQQVIAKKKYDFVFDRTSDLTMLYGNPKYDISKTIISYLTKSEKEREREEEKLKKQKNKEDLEQRIEAQKKRKAEKESKVIHR
ncbi:OmpH family outer membrane protein [Flavicella marina]|uniref:OmpH family outer membrane protein n=1 Tax=Flavicella marina TaxID=1475951 RepID=UPI001264A725|nr:OmpH family outer membrane protein [Flavicella marina]